MSNCCKNCSEFDNDSDGNFWFLERCPFYEHNLDKWNVEKDYCSQWEEKISMTNIYKQAIDKFGSGKQFIKAVEELAELQQAIIKKFLNPDVENDNLFEEIADVEIMLEQLKIIFDCHDIIETVKEKKLKRLKGLIENG